jgi:cellulose synthase/poly-beta-1,6-N-acetylglucosamine synthase-like glycosyltransferase
MFPVKKTPNLGYSPKVSILIAAYNEERCIKETIARLLESDYNPEKIEIIVGSDNSTDATNSIIEEIARQFPRVKLVTFTQRNGKAKIMNELFGMASGEILVFCDANTMYHKDAIRKMVELYTDESVGGVCGRLVLNKIEKAMDSGSKELSYWNYETIIKALEGKLGILIGSNGGIYSIRKKYYVPPMTNPLTADDLYTTMKVLEQRKKFLYRKDAVAEEDMAPSVEAEFSRKVRITTTNISTIKPLAKLLMPSYGLVAYGFWFHKIVRWFCPFLFVLALISNAMIFTSSILLMYTFYIQLAFYLAALIGSLLKLIGIKIQPMLLCSYFVMANIALMIGIFKFLTNQKYTVWESPAR